MRFALTLFLVFAPLALAAQAGDPVGDVETYHWLGAGRAGASPYRECDHDAADLTGLSVVVVDGFLVARLDVVDPDAGAACVLPLVATFDERESLLTMMQEDATRAERRVQFKWRVTDGDARSAATILFRDGRSGMCLGGGVGADATGYALRCPVEGIAHVDAGFRTYDLRGLTWTATASTHIVTGTMPSFVAFRDHAGPLVAIT